MVLALALAALALVLVPDVIDEAAPPGVEEVLGRWEEVVGASGDDGVRSFVASSFSTVYFVGDELAGTPWSTWEYTTWFEAPNRQRAESRWVALSRPSGGEGLSGYTETQVWDGTDHWVHHWIGDDDVEGVTVRRQLPRESVHFGPVLFTAAITERCRAASVAGEEVLGGRDAWIVELTRARCGAPFPGADGRIIFWIDRATGLLLRTRTYSSTGRLSGETEITLLEINGPIDPARFRLEVPDGVTLDDQRMAKRAPGPVVQGRNTQPISLAHARSEASFGILLPASVPDGFALESVEHYSAEGLPGEVQSPMDWVRLRYASAEGDWIVIEQGFGGWLIRFAFGAAERMPQGVTLVGSADARWVDASPTGWEPGAMMLLGIEARRAAGGWFIGADEGTVFDGPFRVALASNRLTLEQLVAVAESLR
ncbi:MAG: hypothetical protein OXC71_05485 [Chloroflexi bacterium]|nr:hypothetical protein [Chloroflexota bacterium]